MSEVVTSQEGRISAEQQQLIDAVRHRMELVRGNTRTVDIQTRPTTKHEKMQVAMSWLSGHTDPSQPTFKEKKFLETTRTQVVLSTQSHFGEKLFLEHYVTTNLDTSETTESLQMYRRIVRFGPLIDGVAEPLAEVCDEPVELLQPIHEVAEVARLQTELALFTHLDFLR